MTQVVDALLPALLEARRVMAPIERDRTGQIGDRRYGYADLADVLRAVVGPLAAQGLLHQQPFTLVDDVLTVTTKVVHVASGQELELASVVWPFAGSPQQFGSLLSYVRRYSLVAALGLQPEGEDDDGAVAERSSKQRSRSSTSSSGTKADPDTVAAHVERLERAAARGMLTLLPELTHTPPEIIGAIGGPRRISQLKARAEEADSEVAPA